MNLRFSYRNHLFAPMLVSSLFAHGILFSVGGFFPSPAQFGVEHAPSSMEVILFEKKERPKQRPIEEPRVLSVNSPISEAPKIPERKEKEVNNAAPRKTIYIPPVRGALQEPKTAYLKNPAPIYPNFARDQGWEGVVLLKVLVQKNGHSAQVVVEQSSGYKILDESALNAVKRWRFRPAQAGSLSFSSWVKVPIRFILIE